MPETPSLNRRGSYRDEQGQIWTVAKAEAGRLGVSPTAIARYLPEGAATLTVRNRGGQEVVAYLRADMRRGVRHLLNPVDPDAVRVVQSGRRYAIQKVVAGELGVSVGVVRESKGPVYKIKIKTPKGPRTFLCIDDLKTQPSITGRLNTEIEVDEYGYYNDEEGAWCTINAFWDLLLSAVKEKTNKRSLLAKANERCKSKVAKSRYGIPGAQIFLVSELAEKTLDNVNPHLRIDKETGYCLDEQGEKWSTIEGWANLMQVKRNAIYAGIKDVFGSLDKVPHKEGFNSVGRKDLLYSETVIKKILAYILEAEIQVSNGICRRVYHSVKKLRETIPVSDKRIHKKLADINCPSVIGIDRQSGREVKVYEVEAARAAFKQQINIVLETDDECEVRNDPQYGRLLTATKYLAEHPDISERKFAEALKASSITRIKRRDIVLRRIVELYPVRDLNRLMSNGNGNGR